MDLSTRSSNDGEWYSRFKKDRVGTTKDEKTKDEDGEMGEEDERNLGTIH